MCEAPPTGAAILTSALILCRQPFQSIKKTTIYQYRPTHLIHAAADTAPAATSTPHLVEEGGGARGIEGGAGGLGGGPLDAVRKRELELAIEELLDGGSLDGRGDIVTVELRVVPVEGTDTSGDDTGIDDLDGLEPGAMTTSKLGVHLSDGTAKADITELFVHVVGTGARVVTEGDAVVLDDVGVALPDLVDGEDVTSGLLHLVKLVEEVPETGLGDDLIGGEDPHAVDRRGGVGLSGGPAADDVVLTNGRHFEY